MSAGKHQHPISKFLPLLSFRTKLMQVLAAQAENGLNNDSADSDELHELIASLQPHDPSTFERFNHASAPSFRRFTETAMTLVELEIGDTAAVLEHGRSKTRITEFLVGRCTRQVFYYGEGSTFYLRRMAAAVSVRNDLIHRPRDRGEELSPPTPIPFQHSDATNV